MLKKSTKPKVVQLLSKKFEEEEFSTLFLIDVTVNEKSGFIRVYLDGDEGVKFSDCQKISRYLESFLDEDVEMSETYTLEVSSPGIKRSLSNLRQFPQHVGRTFSLTLIEGKSQDVKLTKVENGELHFETVPPKKKKKDFVIETIHTTFERIKEAVVKISFN